MKNIHISSGQWHPINTTSNIDNEKRSFCDFDFASLFRFAFTELIRKLGWNKVAALTQDGQKYSDYMSTLQDTFQEHQINFVLNRKFPANAADLTPVNTYFIFSN